MTEKYNTAVIGAGPGGYVAALRLGAQNKKVAIVEQKHFGGTCLNVGCIPTKTLLHSSQIVADIRHGAEHGITVDNCKIDLAAMIKRKDGVVKKLRGGVGALLKARKVDVFTGKAKLLGANSIQVTLNDGKASTLETENIIIATGSTPAVPGVFPQDRTKVMTSDEILDLKELPESLLIVGGGVIGCEFATIFSELGTKVTIVELLDRILPMADENISKTLTKSLKDSGVEIYTAIGVDKMEIVSGKVAATLQNSKKIETTLSLVCTGRRPCTDDLGLETAKIATEKGFITIDDRCRTNLPNVYAIGDVTGKWQLAHVASRQATVAANNICGKDDTEDYAIVPSAVYCHPEIAWVGLTEKEAKNQGHQTKAATFSLMASGLAMAYGSTGGFVKIIADEDDVILGAHIMCPHASDVIQEVAVLMKSECTLHELEATIHGHPTFAETLAEATESLLGHPIHSM